MTSRAERRRRQKAAKITLPGGVEMPQRSTGRDRRGVNAQETPESATETAVTARLRISGTPDSPEARRASLAPLMGCDVGRKIAATIKAPDRRADLWRAVMHIRRVWVAYDRAIGAPNRHAQCLRILAPTEALTTEDAPVDDRPQEARDRSAVSAWMALQGWLDHVDRPARSATIIAVVDDAGLTNWPGILAALECVDDGIKGQPIKWRGKP